MACGHTTHGKDAATGEPVCVVCWPKPESVQVAAEPPPEGRMMRCSYHHGADGKPCAARTTPRPSDTSAPFFTHRPGQEFDEFYDGCWGWD